MCYRWESDYTKLLLVTIGLRLILIAGCISNIFTTKRIMYGSQVIRKKFCFRTAVNCFGILTLALPFWGTGFWAEKRS